MLALLFSTTVVFILLGMTVDSHWFISALNQFGETVWLRAGSEDDKEIYPINIEINKLLVGDDGSELYAHSKYKGVPRMFALDTLDGKGIQVSSGRLGRRKLFQISETPMPNPPDPGHIFPPYEEQARTVIIDWFLGLLGGVGGAIGFIGAGYGLYQFKKGLNDDKKAKLKEENERNALADKRLEQDWDKEHVRRKIERDFLNKLKKTKTPSHF